MSKRVIGLAAIVVFLLASGLMAAHHLNGTWTFSVSLGDGQGGDATIELEEKENGELTGSYSGAVGEETVSGKVDGSKVEIWFESAQAGKVTYKGEFKDGKISGECTYGQLGLGTFTATKK